MLSENQHYFYSQTGRFDPSLNTSPTEIFIGKNVSKTLFLDVVAKESHSSGNWVRNRISESANVPYEEMLAEHMKNENATGIILKITLVNPSKVELLFKKVKTR